ncbi:LysR family transcriptional regulator [Bacillus sp. 1P06AnD]|uniref:LysR family transcriptional regulator n=1 Tax=Bacillus sp. 1P06AnD TaxID=3132208 RepID=UPI0039A2AE00
MELRHLQTFQIVAEELNLTRSAMRLNYSQPTITKHLKILENEIGSPLFVTEGNKKKLTKIGELFFQHTKNILNEMYTLNEEIKDFNTNSQTIRLCGLDFYGYYYYLPNIREFQRKHPEVTFEIIGASCDNSLTLVNHHECDFGISVGKPMASEFTHYSLENEDLVLFASSKIAKDPSYKENCIEKYPVLLDKKANHFYYGFLKQGLTFPKMIHCSSDETVKEGVLTGSYIGIVGTGRIQDEVDRGELTILDTYSKNVPVKFFTLTSNLSNPLLESFYHSFIDSWHMNKQRAEKQKMKKIVN